MIADAGWLEAQIAFYWINENWQRFKPISQSCAPRCATNLLRQRRGNSRAQVRLHIAARANFGLGNCAIFINNDNTALASFDSVIAVARLQNIPVFVSDLDCLSKGALAALGADQYALGRQVGKMIANILRNPEVASSTIMEYPDGVRGEGNKKVAAELKIVLPSNV